MRSVWGASESSTEVERDGAYTGFVEEAHIGSA